MRYGFPPLFEPGEQGCDLTRDHSIERRQHPELQLERARRLATLATRRLRDDLAGVGFADRGERPSVERVELHRTKTEWASNRAVSTSMGTSPTAASLLPYAAVHHDATVGLTRSIIEARGERPSAAGASAQPLGTPTLAARVARNESREKPAWHALEPRPR